VAQYPARKIINPLISLFCDPDPLVRWRAVDATGRVVSEEARTNMESARVIMRRLTWMLNDESGGIGWGAPEAMGAILARHARLASEYGDILLSYIQPACNFLEHPVLQRGVLWGIGHLAASAPEIVRCAAPCLIPFLQSDDPYHRGYAAWAAGYMGDLQLVPTVKGLIDDPAPVILYTGGRLQETSVGELAETALKKLVQ